MIRILPKTVCINIDAVQYNNFTTLLRIDSVANIYSSVASMSIMIIIVTKFAPVNDLLAIVSALPFVAWFVWLAYKIGQNAGSE
jgi:hypothetical protein